VEKRTHIRPVSPSPPERMGARLELVLKCDSVGSVEAVTTGLSSINVPDIKVLVVHSGIGHISGSDILFAETSGRLIVGFQVNVVPGIASLLKAHRVEVRLYDLVYTLIDDIKTLAEDLAPAAPSETILGSAKVIALFKSTRKGIIIGCEVTSGFLSVGRHFRIISAMGPVYSGVISSMHIGENVVQKAVAGQQAAIKLTDFKNVRMGDIVETYSVPPSKKVPAWKPSGEIIRI
jgi:translation initiation factor IF-2